jgi:peptide/nickel transport system substrate-binding protein
MLVETYSELSEIYLTNVPSFTQMYRPAQFYTVNVLVWTNYPAADDGLNTSPMNLRNGYGGAGLYRISRLIHKP